MKKIEPRIILVKFVDQPDSHAKTYAYWTDLNLEKGDLAIVASPYGDERPHNASAGGIKLGSGYAKTVRVVSTEPSATEKRSASKWIVDHINEKPEAKRVKQREELRELTEEMRNELIEAEREEAISEIEEKSSTAGALARKIAKLEKKLGITGANPATENYSVFR